MNNEHALTDTQRVHDFWNRESCGEVYARGSAERERFESHARTRYALEPYIRPFARFEDGADRRVLEIGVGFGADHVEWAKAGPRELQGIDLTDRAIENTRRRLHSYGLDSTLQVADAEALPFADGQFDIVYSWGVLHHSPNTDQAIDEVHRVLKPGGRAAVMIYHTWSFVGYMLWLRYALLAGRPLRSLRDVYANHLESPGTKAYTRAEARALFHRFADVGTQVQLCHADLLESEAGQQHRGLALTLAKRLWPRGLIRTLFKRHGLFLMIDARKSAA